MENEKAEKFPVIRLGSESAGDIEVEVAREQPVTIMLNGTELVTMLCTPHNLDWLSAGFLQSEGFLDNRGDIKKIRVDSDRGVVRVETTGNQEPDQDILFKRIISSGCGRGASFYSPADMSERKIDSGLKMAATDIFTLAAEFQHHSELYLSTHGVHSAALCSGKRILAFNEDIGRHNAIDKIFGQCLLEDIQTNDCLLITSGRISSEILHKVVKRDIPIVVSISAPTSLGVKIAESLGITLIASVKGRRRMDVFSHAWRVID